jgi:hypothetical protein
VRGNLCLSAVAEVARTSRVTRVHRTTTTATLLVTVAVSALTGCVTVQRPPVSGPPTTAPSQLPAPGHARPDGQAEPQIVQAPAQEALSMIDPSPSSKPGGTTSRDRTPGAAGAPARPQPPQPAHAHPGHHPERPARPARPGPWNPDAPHHRKPRVEIPDVARSVPKSVPRGPKDVCGLGRKYGRWQEGSPESVICDQTYGR